MISLVPAPNSRFILKLSRGITGKKVDLINPPIRPPTTRNKAPTQIANVGQLNLFIDEFTNFLDTQIGFDAYQLLSTLGYHVMVLKNVESGRSYISKGLLKQAKALANKNVELYKDKVTKNTPLIGIEPSAILTFKDEYLKLADNKEAAISIANNTFLVEEFIHKK